MISRNKHIVLDTDTYNGTSVIKLKIITGFSSKNIEKCLDIKENWVPNSNDVLYFFSGCSVPRFKLKDKFKVTTKLDKATTCFISKSEINSSKHITTHKGMYSMKDYMIHKSYPFKEMHDSFMKFYDDLIKSWNIGSGRIYPKMTAYYENQKSLFKSLVDRELGDFYITDDLRGYSWTNFGSSAGSLIRLNNMDNFSSWGIRYYYKEFTPKIDSRIFEISKDSELRTCNKDIYFENEIYNYINENNFVIDYNKYNEFNTMCHNRDEENLVLCMELMSNSDFKKSFPFLLFLIYQYGTDFAKLKESSHVNFKSLINFLNLQDYGTLNLYNNDVINCLKNAKQCTQENMDMWTQLYNTGEIKRPNYKIQL
jgi:hypothetical protein